MSNYGIGRLRSFLLSGLLFLAFAFAIAWPIWSFARKAKGACGVAVAVAAATATASV